MNAEKVEKIEAWYKVAERDLQSAELLLQHSLEVYDVVCFHCQQAAEKYLKAYIIYFDEEPPKVHDIRQLIAILLLKDKEILSQEDAVTLNDYAVRYRYPDHLEIDDINIARKALALSMEVKDYIKRKIGI